jgi:radical SAM superfamily enzyme YgiQ (UPF0313 family)
VKDPVLTHALLLQPPPGDLTGPYPALCYLKAYAAKSGLDVKVRDLGIEALHYLVHPARTADFLTRASLLCRDLESQKSLDDSQQRRYGWLLAGSAMQDNPRWFADNIALFQDSKAFFDYRRYKLACHALNAFFRLLSGVHFPTRLTPAHYPTATEAKTLAGILAHADAGRNPYVRYYDDVLIPQVEAVAPPVVGISMVFANQSVQALVLGYLIKKRLPHIHVTLGGAFLSQWAINADDSQLAQLFTCTDSIICGEGEQALVELIQRVEKKGPLDGIPNLIHKDPLSGSLKRFKKLNYTDIVDQPPPDYSDLAWDSYLTAQRIIPYCISRGCYWGRCVFCQNRYGDQRMRRYQTVPVEKAILEMRRLYELHGSQHFNFSNDVLDPAWLKQFSRSLLDSGQSFIWNTDLRAEKAFDAETCRLMAQAGLNAVAIGFESGCQKTLDAMDKGNRVKTTRAVMQNLYQAGVATQAMGMFGFPGESEADGSETVRFLEDHVEFISYYVMGLLMVVPGSRMHEDPLAHGVTSISYATNPLKTPEPVWTSATRMSLDTVNRLYQRLNRLEEIYAVNDYPYVGGLSTNHSFLYYTLGPDILKSLRREENDYLLKLRGQLGLDQPSIAKKAVKSLVAHVTMPYRIHPSRFAIDQLTIDESGPPPAALAQENESHLYLISVRNRPVAVSSGQAELLSRINGRRSLKKLLDKIDPQNQKSALSFLWFLGSMELTDYFRSPGPVPKEPGRKRQGKGRHQQKRP